MFGENDITWCASECKVNDCFRNQFNMKEKTGIHSFADFKGTEDCPLNRTEVTIQERGWAGHFICSRRCSFRRNTLVICGTLKYIVSTVGGMIAERSLPPYIEEGQIETVGYNRWYETMAFESLYDEYDDADVTKPIEFESEWGIWGKTWEDVEKEYGKKVDEVANQMHETVVEEIKIKIKEDYINAKTSGLI